jgi:signal recognition particle subunit SRP54
MFETLSERLGAILDKLTRKGALTEVDVSEAMREVRRALLEADVALDVVRGFTESVKAKAVGQEVVRSITPGQMVIKIVHDELVRVLGSDAQRIRGALLRRNSSAYSASRPASPRSPLSLARSQQPSPSAR